MRIALIPSAYAPAVGGVEELTARLTRRLLGSGDEVEVWTIRHPADLPEHELVDGVRVQGFAMPMPRFAVGALASFPRDATHAWATMVDAESASRGGRCWMCSRARCAPAPPPAEPAAS